MPPTSLQRLVGLLVWSTAGFLASASLWILLRRLQGQLQQPLPAPMLIALGLVLAGLVVAAEAVGRRSGFQPNARSAWRQVGGPAALSLAVVLLGVAVSLPANQLSSTALLWLAILFGITAAWGKSARRANKPPSPGIGRPEAGSLIGRQDGERPEFDRIAGDSTLHLEEVDEPEAEDGLLPAGVSQRIIRARDERGSEVIYGTLRCEIAPGQRQLSVHVAFCPPLARIGDFTADQLTGPAAQIKTSILEAFGAGLELKLAVPSKEPVDVQLQFFAFETSTHAAAV